VAVNLALLALLGVHRGADTERYVEGASDLLAGRAFRGPAGWVYVGYNGLLAAADAVGIGHVGVVCVQIAVAACAAMAVYDLGRQVGGRLAGVLAAVFLIVDYDIARWHLYVLTDSLYISLVVIVAWAAHRAVGRGASAYLAASAALLVIALIRPNGWAMIPIVIIYWLVRSPLHRTTRLVAAAAVVIVCGGSAVAFAVVQFGRPTPPTRELVATGRLNRQRLPFARAMTKDRLNPARMPQRLLTELGHIQPEFSWRHKFFVVAMLAVVYPLAILGFVRSRGQPIAQFMAAIVACHLMVIAVTFSDRDGRYLLYVFPFLVVFAACGAVGAAGRR
jgi:4-amino-4-deoxy-L-arabinose transferase-like glycosyltransferase